MKHTGDLTVQMDGSSSRVIKLRGCYFLFFSARQVLELKTENAALKKQLSELKRQTAELKKPLSQRRV